MDLDGLQRSIQYKYKYYCEMCKKQCKDANGFKCHCNTEHHKQMMKLLAENQDYYVSKFSEEFESGFLSLLKSKYLNIPVSASKVYSQFGHDKYNVRLNSTRWATLTSFLEHLAATGKCKLNKTDKGWMLLCGEKEKDFTKVREEKDKETVKRKENRREEKRLKKLIENADKLANSSQLAPMPLIRSSNEAITIELNSSKKEDEEANAKKHTETSVKAELDEREKEFEKHIKEKEKEAQRELGKKETHNERDYWKKELTEFIEEKKAKQEPQSKPKETPWITENIVVKIIDKSIGKGKYYKKKAIIHKIHNNYVAEIKIIDSGDIMKIDQANLETVIPNINGKVLLLIGKYKGEKGIMRGLYIDEGKASIEVSDGRVLKVPYEGFSKIG